MNQNLEIWKDYTGRHDLEAILPANQLGYEVIFNSNDIKYGRVTPSNVPHNGVNFAKDEVFIWECVHRPLGVVYQRNDGTTRTYHDCAIDAIHCVNVLESKEA